jgi:hypothetical protein
VDFTWSLSDSEELVGVTWRVSDCEGLVGYNHSGDDLVGFRVIDYCIMYER